MKYNYIEAIFCYFYNEEVSDNINHYLSLVNYFIEDMNVNLNQTYNFQTSDYINQIKIVLSSNNNFFICISVSSNGDTHCYINNGKSNISMQTSFLSFLASGLNAIQNIRGLPPTCNINSAVQSPA